jgi:hypothetical protein
MNSPFVVPVVLFVMIGLSVILRGPLGQAIADRVRGGAVDMGADPRVREELDSLRLEVDELRGQLAEAHERIDFAERLLARRDELVPLPQPKV